MGSNLYLKTFPRLEIIIDFIKRKKLFDGILLYGSSLKSKNPNDYDIILYKEKLTPIDMLKFFELMEEINSKFAEANSAYIFGFRKKESKIHLKVLGFTLVDYNKFQEDKSFFNSIKNKGFVIFHGKSFFNKLWDINLNKNDFIIAVYDEDEPNPFHIRKLFIKFLEFNGIYDFDKDNALNRFKREFPQYGVSSELEEFEDNFSARSKKAINDYYNLREQLIRDFVGNDKVRIKKEESLVTILTRKYDLIKLWYESENLDVIKRILISEERKFQNKRK